MKDTQTLTSISADRREAGFLTPIIGRKVNTDVFGFPGFPLIRAGETITREVAEKAQSMGRLYELTAAAGPE